MKTAEEWLDEVSIKVLCKDKLFAHLIIDDIKQIQLDAMKEGYMIGVQDTKNKTTTDLNEIITTNK